MTQKVFKYVVYKDNMNKNGQNQFLLNPRTISFILGGAILGYFLFQTTNAAIIGGLIGFLISLIR